MAGSVVSGGRLTVDEVDELVRLARAGVAYRSIAARARCALSTVYLLAGGPRQPGEDRRSPRHFSLAEREEIRVGVANGASLRVIAAKLGRNVSSVSREVARNGGRDAYRAHVADERAWRTSRRPRDPKLVGNDRLRAVVEEKFELRWSPQQIAAHLKLAYPHDEGMRVSHETIYQSLFVQGRGSLRKELTSYLRTRRTSRKPRGRKETRGKLSNMILVRERPAEADDRAVPGHWEGDLVLGKAQRSQIGTLVERKTRFVMLFELPRGRGAEEVRDALAQRILGLPEALRRTLTWDQGKEMAEHQRFTIDTGVQVYFCDPHSPWQRGSNENTNGLLRQYFPKGTDLSVHTQAHLDVVADQLNTRPRQTLGWKTPAEMYAQEAGVALTG